MYSIAYTSPVASSHCIRIIVRGFNIWKTSFQSLANVQQADYFTERIINTYYMYMQSVRCIQAIPTTECKIIHVISMRLPLFINTHTAMHAPGADWAQVLMEPVVNLRTSGYFTSLNFQPFPTSWLRGWLKRAVEIGMMEWPQSLVLCCIGRCIILSKGVCVCVCVHVHAWLRSWAIMTVFMLHKLKLCLRHTVLLRFYVCLPVLTVWWFDLYTIILCTEYLCTCTCTVYVT